MAQDDAIPPVPVPPTGSGVPPVEPPPTPATPAAAPPPPPGDAYAPPAPAAAPANPYAQPQPAYAPPAYGAAPAGPPQGLAIASLACGIGGLLLSFFGFGLLVSIAAVITGHMAQRRQPYARGFWITGLITGYVGILIGLVFGLILLISLFAVLGSVSYLG